MKLKMKKILIQENIIFSLQDKENTLLSLI